VTSYWDAILEEDEGREGGDAELGCYLGRRININLTNGKLLTMLVGQVLHQRGEEATRSTPRCPEVDKDWDG